MYKNYIKRIIDLLLAGIGFLIISPVFLLLWLLLAVANKGAGAFFTQERPGKNERIFRVVTDFVKLEVHGINKMI